MRLFLFLISKTKNICKGFDVVGFLRLIMDVVGFDASIIIKNHYRFLQLCICISDLVDFSPMKKGL